MSGAGSVEWNGTETASPPIGSASLKHARDQLEP